MNIMIAFKDTCINNVKIKTAEPSLGRNKQASTKIFGMPIDTRF
jgi:hypothetical protein